MELRGLELGGDLLDTADGEMKKSEELLGKGEGGGREGSGLYMTFHDRFGLKLHELQQPDVQY